MQLKFVLGREGLDLLSRLLDLNPSTRITAKEALKHPFLKEVPKLGIPNYSIGFARSDLFDNLPAINLNTRHHMIQVLENTSNKLGYQPTTYHLAVRLCDCFLSFTRF